MRKEEAMYATVVKGGDEAVRKRYGNKALGDEEHQKAKKILANAKSSGKRLRDEIRAQDAEASKDKTSPAKSKQVSSAVPTKATTHSAREKTVSQFERVRAERARREEKTQSRPVSSRSQKPMTQFERVKAERAQRASQQRGHSR